MTTDADVMALIAAGHCLAVVVQRSNWATWDVTQLAKANGWDFEKLTGAPVRSGRPLPKPKAPRSQGFTPS